MKMDTSKFDEINAAFAEAQKKAKELGKSAVADALKTLFDQHPRLEAVQWSQYTPYFNDGDPCEFGVHDAYYKLEGRDEGGDDGEGFEYCSKYGDDYKDPEIRPIVDSVIQFGQMIQGCEEALEFAFGDHVQITATREGVQVEEHEHD